jgi:hypothetical protein
MTAVPAADPGRRLPARPAPVILRPRRGRAARNRSRCTARTTGFAEPIALTQTQPAPCRPFWHDLSGASQCEFSTTSTCLTSGRTLSLSFNAASPPATAFSQPGRRPRGPRLRGTSPTRPPSGDRRYARRRAIRYDAECRHRPVSLCPLRPGRAPTPRSSPRDFGRPESWCHRHFQ